MTYKTPTIKVHDLVNKTTFLLEDTKDNPVDVEYDEEKMMRVASTYYQGSWITATETGTPNLFTAYYKGVARYHR